jgi:hypothetical protein
MQLVRLSIYKHSALDDKKIYPFRAATIRLCASKFTKFSMQETFELWLYYGIFKMILWYVHNYILDALQVPRL